MKVIYSDQHIAGLDTEFSIFLLGPTPRSNEVSSWRPRALEILEDLKFKGIVLVPERCNRQAKMDYLDQIEWELEGLDHCSVICAWIPRELPLMPAFTSNVEFGRYVDSGRLLYGRPADAEKTRYLDALYRKVTSFDPFDSLESLLSRAVLERTLRT